TYRWDELQCNYHWRRKWHACDCIPAMLHTRFPVVAYYRASPYHKNKCTWYAASCCLPGWPCFSTEAKHQLLKPLPATDNYCLQSRSPRGRNLLRELQYLSPLLFP